MKGMIEFVLLLLAMPIIIAGVVWAFLADQFQRGRNLYDMLDVL